LEENMARTTPSTSIKRAALKALQETAAADAAIAQEIAGLTGNPSTSQEEADYQELVALLQSLDGPEYSMRTVGYNRAPYPDVPTVNPFNAEE
jgi:hypothetical protein